MNIMFGVHLGSVLDPKLTHRLLLVSPPGGKMSRWRQKVSPVAQESFFSKWYKLNIFHERIRVLLWCKIRGNGGERQQTISDEQKRC